MHARCEAIAETIDAETLTVKSRAIGARERQRGGRAVTSVTGVTGVTAVPH
jgi:hypothetical protein